jgi:hypothetical protein
VARVSLGSFGENLAEKRHTLSFLEETLGLPFLIVRRGPLLLEVGLMHAERVALCKTLLYYFRQIRTKMRTVVLVFALFGTVALGNPIQRPSACEPGLFYFV